VLCDPVLDGVAYLEQLRSLQNQLRDTWHYAPVPCPGAAHEELLGYRYTAALIQQVGMLKLGQEALPRAERVSLVLSADDPRCRQFQVRLVESRLHGNLRLVPDLGSWEAVDVDLFTEPRLLPGMRGALTDLLRESA
jgi:hypothetical protein